MHILLWDFLFLVAIDEDRLILQDYACRFMVTGYATVRRTGENLIEEAGD